MHPYLWQILAIKITTYNNKKTKSDKRRTKTKQKSYKKDKLCRISKVSISIKFSNRSWPWNFKLTISAVNSKVI